MALGLFRCMAAIARDYTIANTFGSSALLIVFLLGGFIVPKGEILIILYIIHEWFFHQLIVLSIGLIKVIWLHCFYSA